MEKVSIIIPVYNVEKYLANTIESVLNQTYTNLEIILVDDCSKDGSRQIMEDYALKDSRICCLFQTTNQGVSEARNRGLDAMTGEWVCFCDGDDWYEPQYVEKMMGCAKQNEADYIICSYQISSINKPPIPVHLPCELRIGCDSRLVIALGPISSCTHMISSRLFREAGVRYPKECRQYEELPVIPALAKYAEKIGVVDEPLYNYYQRGDGSSASNMSINVRKNFLKGLDGLAQALGDGYEKELEYHAIYALHYGEILALCKEMASTQTICAAIDEIEKQYPNYLQNPYLENMGTAKKLFLKAEKARLVSVLRIFSKLHSLVVN